MIPRFIIYKMPKKICKNKDQGECKEIFCKGMREITLQRTMLAHEHTLGKILVRYTKNIMVCATDLGRQF